MFLIQACFLIQYVLEITRVENLSDVVLSFENVLVKNAKIPERLER